MSTPPVRTEDLLAHAEWVRRLARRLVADEAAAADLVQDTWVAALRHPPSESRSLRPWLGRVLRHFAWRRHRTEARRTSREEFAARPELVPPESDASERLESQRLLVETLLALEEPLRATLVERYLEERSAADIARRHGVPAGTVRWRAKRGLERMRELLDERQSGGREAWVLALLPLAAAPGGGSLASDPAPPTAAGGSVLTGALTLNAILKATVAALVLLAATLGWRVLRSDPESALDVAIAAPSPEEVASPLRGPESEPGDVVAGEPLAPRRAVTEQGSEASGAEGPADSAAARVHARFLDEWGRVLGGVVLAETRGDATAESASDGSVVCHVPMDPDRGSYRTELTASAPGLATRFFGVGVERGEDTWLGDIVMSPGGRVAGIVVGDDGQPVANAKIELADPELPPGEPEYLRLEGPFYGRRGVSTESDVSGRFAIEGAAVGPTRVWARAHGTRWTISEPVFVSSDRDLDLRLVLERLHPEEHIAGVVLAPNGEPVPGALVMLEYKASGRSGQEYSVARDDGSFLIVLSLRGEQWVSATDSERRFARSERLAVDAGSLDLRLQLRPLAEFELKVFDEESGEPLSRYSVQVDYASGGSEPPIRVDEAGGAAIVRVVRKVFALRVKAIGYETRELGPLGPELPEVLECALTPRAGLRGRVLAGERPVSGADIGLYRRSRPNERIIVNGLRSWVAGSPTSEASSDADGAFHIPLPQDGSYVLRAERAGFAPTELSLDAGDPPSGPVALQLSAGGAIEGRVAVPRGVDPAGTIVLIDRGAEQPRAKRVGPDGRFRFEHLIPGPWLVQLSDSEPDPSTIIRHSSTSDEPIEPFNGNCEVFEGRTTIHDLDVEQLEDCIVRGRLVLDGGLDEEWTATVWPELALGLYDRDDLPSAHLAPDGSFEIASRRRGHARLALRSASGTVVSGLIQLVGGEIEWEHSWRSGALAGKARTVPTEVETPFYFVGGDGEVTVCVPLRPDAWGQFRHDDVPAGLGRIVRWGPGHEAASPELWRTAAEVRIEPGERATVELE